MNFNTGLDSRSHHYNQNTKQFYQSKNLLPCSLCCQPLPTPNFWKLLICALSLRFFFVRTSHKWIFWDWLLSLSIMPLRFIQIIGVSIAVLSFLSLAYSLVWIYHTLFTHSPLEGIWIVSSVWHFCVNWKFHFSSSYGECIFTW